MNRQGRKRRLINETKAFLLFFSYSCDYRFRCKRHCLSVPCEVSRVFSHRSFALSLFLSWPEDVKFPLSVCRQWLEDALRENDPTAVQLFLVGTKKDMSVCPRAAQSGRASERFCVFVRSQMSVWVSARPSCA